MNRPFPLLLFALTVDNMIASAETLNLDQSVDRALRSHPGIRAARMEICRAQALLIDAGKMENPVFEISYDSTLKTGGDREAAAFAGISQKFPVTDRLCREKELRESDVRLACAEVLEVERRFIGEVQRNFIAVLTALEKRGVLKQLEDDTEKYVDLARKRLEAALGSELDVASAETEQILARQAARTGEGEVSVALSRLKPKLSITTGATLRLSGDLDSVIQSLRNSVRMSVPDELDRPDVAVAKLRQDRANAKERLAIASRKEDWEVALGYESERSVDEPIGPEREHFVGIGLKIPLPFRKTGESGIVEAQAEKKQACHQMEAIQAQSLAEVAESIDAVRKASATVDSLEGRIIPLLEERESKTRKTYQDGLVDFLQVLQLQQQRARIHLSLVQAKEELALALVQLQESLGSNPALRDHSDHRSKGEVALARKFR